MKAKMLRIAKCKTEKEFYNKFPSQEAFMKVYGKEFKKAQMGAYIGGDKSSNTPMINFNQLYEAGDKLITGLTDKERQEIAQQQAQLIAVSSKGGKSGGGSGELLGSALSIAGSMFGGGKGGSGSGSGGGMSNMMSSFSKRNGGNINKAQSGSSIPAYYQNNNTFFQDNPGPITGPQNYQNPQVQSVGSFQAAGTTYNNISAPNVSSMDTSIPQSIDNSGKKGNAGMDKILKIAGPVGSLVKGYKALRAERQQRKVSEQQLVVSDLALQASATRPELLERKYVRPEDALISDNNLSPSYGVGTNVLAKNGTKLKLGGKFKGNKGEIQNTYDPNDIYSDLGYEPLSDSEIIKQYKQGGFIKAQSGFSGGSSGGSNSGGSNPIYGQITGQVGQITGGIMGNNAGSQIGGTVGGEIGNIWGPLGKLVGQTVGQVAGGFIDTNGKKIKRNNAGVKRNITAMGINQGAQGLQNQYQSYMEYGGEVPSYKEGGYMNSEYNPQVITKFGDHSAKDIYDFAHEGMNTLRTGGNVRQNQMFTQQTMAMGGELKTHWGGNAETISQNPYLPDKGETVMFRGQSHDESDGKGNTGIGVTYGNNPVEVERGEPAVKLQDGSTGEDNLVVYGNLQIPNSHLDLLNDPKAKGKKFKNYVNDLSKLEERQNKILDSASKGITNSKDFNSFDKLESASYQANIMGANMKLKDIADKKQKAAALQNSINDTAEEYGLVAEDLAKGKYKIDKNAIKGQAKYGMQIPKAQDGKKVLSDEEQIAQMNLAIANGTMKEANVKSKPITNFVPQGIFNVDPKNLPNQNYEQLIQLPTSIGGDNHLVNKRDPDYLNKVMMAYNEILPYLRNSNAKDLNPNQLTGEMYAMSNNQLEPVQAQLYHPQMDTPYDISHQDQLNEINAQSRTAQRSMGYNPSAQANLAAQTYGAKSNILAEQFRQNQVKKDQVYSGNRRTLDDAQLKNLSILDQQYGRQSQAKSNTKTVTQDALNSISAKYAQNALENKTLQTYENMYNYRYDANGHLINENPLAMFNTSGTGNTPSKDTSGNDLLPIYNKEGQISGYKVKQEEKTKTKKSRNGSIVNALKNF